MNKKHQGTSLDEALQEQCKSPEFQEAFERAYVISELAQRVHELRLKSGLTQTKLAEKASTKVCTKIQSNAVTALCSYYACTVSQWLHHYKALNVCQDFSG